MIDVPDNMFLYKRSSLNWTQFEKSGIEPEKRDVGFMYDVKKIVVRSANANFVYSSSNVSFVVC